MSIVMRKIRVGVLVSGSGTDLQSIIDASKSKKISASVVVVISDRADAYALERARRNNIPTIYLEPKGKKKEEYDKKITDIVMKYKVDLIVLAGYMRILTPPFVRKFYGRIINIHPALLPSFPGINAQKQAFEHGVKVSGCTVHFVNNGVDTGPIIIQKAVSVIECDTIETLRKRILKEEHKILPKAIQLFAEGRLKIEGRKVKVLPELQKRRR
ncbi:MAG: phosphoribosylglycinamide formyltransferase [Thermoplasmata archaeon]